MIQKTVIKHTLSHYSSARENLAYWLSRSPEERLPPSTICVTNTMEVQPDFKELLRVIQRPLIAANLKRKTI